MARTYKRDSRGRFAGGGGGSSRGGGRKPLQRGTNRLTRDNAGRITSVGGDGATARGGRLRTASGNKRATVTARGVKRASPSGAIRKSDVVTARTQNSISRNIEKRNKSGLNPPTAARENQASRVARAERRIAGQKRATAKPAAAAKPAAGSLAATRIEQSKGRASVLSQQKSALNKQLKQISTQIKEAGPSAGGLRLQKLQIQDRLNQTRRDLSAAQSAVRGDTASVNRPMTGARGRSLNREISRNVNAQRSAARASDKARNRQFKADQSRAKKLREVHLKPLASGYAKRSGRNEAEVRKRISAMEPKDQIKLFRQYVKENRAVARAAVARPRRR